MYPKNHLIMYAFITDPNQYQIDLDNIAHGKEAITNSLLSYFTNY